MPEAAQTLAGTLVEAGALLAIAAALALGGRALLAELHVFAAAAVMMLALVTLALAGSLRRIFVAGRADRLTVTIRAAYLTGLLLAVWAVAAPARWNVGATLAILEVAIAFDLVSRLPKIFGPRPF